MYEVTDDTATILIVDDSPENLRVLSCVLERAGYRVRPAVSGDIALRSLHSFMPDLILLDVRMPVMDGYEVCRRIKADAATGDIPVIFFSALHGMEEKVRAFAAGAVDYVTKPFQAEEVLARVDTHVRLRRAQATLDRINRERLRETEERERRLALALHAGRVGTADWEVESDVVVWTQEMEALYGLPRGGFDGTSAAWIALVHPEDREFLRIFFSVWLAARHDEEQWQYRIIRPDGVIRWVEARGCFIRHPDGKPVRLISMHVDVTERRVADQAVARSVERLRGLLAATSAILSQTDVPALQAAAIEAAIGLTGARAGVIGCLGADNDFELATPYPDDGSPRPCWLSQGRCAGKLMALLGDRPTLRLDRTRVLNLIGCHGSGAGQPPALEGLLAVRIDAVECPNIGVVAVFNKEKGSFSDGDETLLSQLALIVSQAYRHIALRQLEQARVRDLSLANNELEAFSYSVSHDLRAPLRSVDGFSRLLLRHLSGAAAGAALDDTTSHYLQRISGAAERMGELIEDLLRLSRLSRTRLVVEALDLSALAREVLAELQQASPERVVDTQVAGGLVVAADRRLMRIVLENLLGNAWKFTGRRVRPTIEVGVLEQEGEPVLFVRDNGEGFDMRYAERLFGVFQRLHSQSEFPGSGIGLVTVQRIVHRHGGRVWADSRPGEGSTFYVHLPPRMVR